MLTLKPPSELSLFEADRPLHHQLALKAYQQSFNARNLTPNYCKTQLNRLADVFNTLTIADPTLPSIRRAIDTFDLTNPRQASRIREETGLAFTLQTRQIACLKAIDRYCRFLQANPTLHAPGQAPLYLPEIYGPLESPVNCYTLPRQSPKRPPAINYLSQSEYRHWLRFVWEQISPGLSHWQTLKACQLYLLCVLAGELGLRLQELLGLEMGHFRLEDNLCLVVAGKGSKGSGHRRREVPVSALAKASLQDFIKQYPRPAKAPLFQNNQGQRLSKNTAHHWMRALTESISQAGLPIVLQKRFGWHSFRRTYATLFLEQGGHPYDLKRNAGWSYLSTLSHYLGCSKTPAKSSRAFPLYPSDTKKPTQKEKH